MTEQNDEPKVAQLSARERLAQWEPSHERESDGRLSPPDFSSLAARINNAARESITSLDVHLRAAYNDPMRAQLWSALATGVGMLFGLADEMLRRNGVPRPRREKLLRVAIEGGRRAVEQEIGKPASELGPKTRAAPPRSLSTRRPRRRNGKRQKRR